MLTDQLSFSMVETMFSIGFPKWVYDVVQKPTEPSKPSTVTPTQSMNIIKVRSRHHKHISVTLAGGQHTIFFNREGIAECTDAVREALFTEMKFRPNRFEILSDTPIPAAAPAPVPTPSVFTAPPVADVVESTPEPYVFDDIVALEELTTEEPLRSANMELAQALRDANIALAEPPAEEPVALAPLGDVPLPIRKRGRPPGSKNLPAPAKKKRGRQAKSKKA